MKAGETLRWNLVTERDPLAQVVQLQLLVRSGSLSDPRDLPGLAGFAGRALLRGTVSRSYKNFTAAIERLGASLHVRSDQDLTVFNGSVLVRNLDPFLALFCEALTQPAFDLNEMRTLQATLLGELRSSLQDPQTLAQRATLQVGYAGTQASCSPEGTTEGLSRITPRDLQNFFTAHYGYENMLLGVISPFEDAEVVRRIEANLSTVPPGSLEARALPVPTFQGRKAVIIDRKEMATSPVFISIPGVGDADSDLSTLEFGNFIFGEDFTSRLMQVLRAENGWTYGVSSSYRQLVVSKVQPSFFSIYLFPSSEYAHLAIPKALSMFEEYARAGLTDQEFAKARESLGNSHAFKVATAEQRLGLRLREKLTGRPFEPADLFAKRLAKLDLATVNSAIARRTVLDRVLITVVGDPQQLKPILGALPGIQDVEVMESDSLGF